MSEKWLNAVSASIERNRKDVQAVIRRALEGDDRERLHATMTLLMDEVSGALEYISNYDTIIDNAGNSHPAADFRDNLEAHIQDAYETVVGERYRPKIVRVLIDKNGATADAARNPSGGAPDEHGGNDDETHLVDGAPGGDAAGAGDCGDGAGALPRGGVPNG